MDPNERSDKPNAAGPADPADPTLADSAPGANSAGPANPANPTHPTLANPSEDFVIDLNKLELGIANASLRLRLPIYLRILFGSG